jgi:uncharacterized protein YkwD
MGGLLGLAILAASSPVVVDAPSAVVAGTNELRARAGLARLVSDPGLVRVAQSRADDMAARRYFDHISPEGRGLREALDEAKVTGWVRVGENLARRTRTPESTVRAWAESGPHRENLLRREFTHVGVALAKDAEGKDTWVQVFAAFDGPR